MTEPMNPDSTFVALDRLRDHYAAAPGDVVGALFDHAPVLALVLDPDGRIVRVSATLLALLQLPERAWEGRAFDELTVPPDGTAFASGALEALRRNGSVSGVEITLRDRDGAGLPARLSAFAELSIEGTPLHYIALLEDLRETRAVLAALDQKAVEAEEASAAKSRFLAAMSHEIRTPMNAILGFAQLLEMSDLDAERTAHVQAILMAGKSMMSLLTDLLDLSQVEAGQMRIEPEVFDLHLLLADLEGWWRGVAKEKGLSFDVSFRQDLPRYVRSDPGRIQQVLSNYIGNAVKFTSAGSVVLSVDIEPSDGAAPSETVHLAFRVRDTGPGIAPEHVARLYRPFVRIDGSGAGARTGWGLGLSICANIAEAMGADVGVETEAGQGATFWFNIPVEIPTAVLGDASAGEQPFDPGPPRKLLLVEDNALNTDVMRQMLEGLGHEVFHAENGFDALTFLETHAVDAVIMDIMMPGLGGVATVKQLRTASHGRRDVPVIACSAHVSLDDEARYRAAGMTVFLPKPVDRRSLAQAIVTAAPA